MTQPAFSTEGPMCPKCERQFVCDEPFYFNQSGYDFDCDECGTKFSVQPNCEWSWTSRVLPTDGAGDKAVRERIPRCAVCSPGSTGVCAHNDPLGCARLMRR